MKFGKLLDSMLILNKVMKVYTGPSNKSFSDYNKSFFKKGRIINKIFLNGEIGSIDCSFDNHYKTIIIKQSLYGVRRR